MAGSAPFYGTANDIVAGSCRYGIEATVAAVVTGHRGVNFTVIVTLKDPGTTSLSTLPERPGQIIFAGAPGKFGMTRFALVILLFVASGVDSLEDSDLVNFDQVLMGVATSGFL